jgi:eukaryotic-like serine/threonine-protein kinase
VETGDRALPLSSGYASRGQRDKIDPRILKSRPADVIDGDVAYWTGGIHALLGEKEEALVWLRRAVDVGNHNYPWFQKDKNYDKLRGDPEYQRIMEEVRRHWEQYKQTFWCGVILRCSRRSPILNFMDTAKIANL